jgi:hypothetical protein
VNLRPSARAQSSGLTRSARRSARPAARGSRSLTGAVARRPRLPMTRPTGRRFGSIDSPGRPRLAVAAGANSTSRSVHGVRAAGGGACRQMSARDQPRRPGDFPGNSHQRRQPVRSRIAGAGRGHRIGATRLRGHRTHHRRPACGQNARPSGPRRMGRRFEIGSSSAHRYRQLMESALSEVGQPPDRRPFRRSRWRRERIWRRPRGRSRSVIRRRRG